MCYKLIWDNLVAGKFPVEQFYTFFSLNRYQFLSADIREHAAKSGIPVGVRYFFIYFSFGGFLHACSVGVHFSSVTPLPHHNHQSLCNQSILIFLFYGLEI